jgi:hypothetical protein
MGVQLKEEEEERTEAKDGVGLKEASQGIHSCRN